MTRVIEGDLIATTASITLVVARFNEFVVDSLLKGALDALKRHGVQEKQITIVKVPGAFELPLAARSEEHTLNSSHSQQSRMPSSA